MMKYFFLIQKKRYKNTCHLGDVVDEESLKCNTAQILESFWTEYTTKIDTHIIKETILIKNTNEVNALKT